MDKVHIFLFCDTIRWYHMLFWQWNQPLLSVNYNQNNLSEKSIKEFILELENQHIDPNILIFSSLSIST